MKPINFIQTIPPQEQKSVLRWYQISVLLLILGLSGIALQQIQQIQNLYAARKEKDALTQHTLNKQLLERHHALKHQESTLKVQLDVVSDITEAPISLHNHLQTIKNLLKPGITLSLCSISTNKISLTLECSQASDITSFITQLGTLPPFATLKLVSLQPNQSAGFLATIIGTLKEDE